MNYPEWWTHEKPYAIMDCLAGMQELPDACIDSFVTDPPYGIKFMGMKWDYDIPSVEIFSEMLRIAKPGAFLLCFAGTRTFHRMACNIEDAGWELRDTIMWVYGTGFPKSHNISKAIDKANGSYVKGSISPNSRDSGASPSGCYGEGVQHKTLDIPQSAEAKHWAGWGTALKPAWEPIIVAMKPTDGTFAENALRYGVAGLNIDGCRIALNGEALPSGIAKRVFVANQYTVAKVYGDNKTTSIKGRYPANLIHDGSDEVLDLFPDSDGQQADIKGNEPSAIAKNTYGKYDTRPPFAKRVDSGSAARFFYCAKASIEEKGTINTHPTVKPLALVKYLCKLTATPDGGVLMDPFLGSGTTLRACRETGRTGLGFEINPECEPIIVDRLNSFKPSKKLDSYF